MSRPRQNEYRRIAQYVSVMEYTLTNKYRNIVLVTSWCRSTFNVIHLRSYQQLYIING